MSTAKIWQTVSSSSNETLSVGEKLGSKLKGGEVLVLNSDLGGGKTTLVKGIAKGLGSSDVVNSPTFMVERVYDCRNNIELHHFDFYRLAEGGMVAQELSEIIHDPKIVIAVEWGDVINNILPVENIAIKLERQADGEDNRKISISYPENLSYVAEELI